MATNNRWYFHNWNPTYVEQTGTCYKSGKSVFIKGKIKISNKNDMDGLLEISSLPFPAIDNFPINIIMYSGIVDVAGVIHPYVEANNSKIYLGQSIGNTGTINDVTASKITNDFTIEFAGKYLTM